MIDCKEYVTPALKRDLAIALQKAWRKYTDLHGEMEPEGSLPQLLVLVGLMNIDGLVNGIANRAIAEWYAGGQR
jgi:hypothetical protein